MLTKLCSSNTGQRQESRAAQLSDQGVCCMCFFQEHADTETTGSPRGSIPPQVTDSLVNGALLESCLPFNLPSLVPPSHPKDYWLGSKVSPRSALPHDVWWRSHATSLRKRLYYTASRLWEEVCSAPTLLKAVSLFVVALPMAVLYLPWRLDRNKNSSYAGKKKLFFRLLGLFYLKQIYLSFFLINIRVKTPFKVYLTSESWLFKQDAMEEPEIVY